MMGLAGLRRFNRLGLATERGLIGSLKLLLSPPQRLATNRVEFDRVLSVNPQPIRALQSRTSLAE
jgi:hypothetical protein